MNADILPDLLVHFSGTLIRRFWHHNPFLLVLRGLNKPNTSICDSYQATLRTHVSRLVRVVPMPSSSFGAPDAHTGLQGKGGACAIIGQLVGMAAEQGRDLGFDGLPQ